MIRIIVQIAEAGMAANVGGPVQTWCKTFDVSCPEVEEFLSKTADVYQSKHVVGIEVISESSK